MVFSDPRMRGGALVVARERVHFVRPSTHTHVRADDPSLVELMRYGDWYRERALQLWLARDTGGGEPHLVEYLESVLAWEGELDRDCMRRVVRRLVAVAPREERRALCRGLRRQLDRFHRN